MELGRGLGELEVMGEGLIGKVYLSEDLKERGKSHRYLGGDCS